MKYKIYVKGKPIPVSEEVYKGYWQVVNHEKYIQRKDIKNKVRPFSDFEYNDFNFLDELQDVSLNVENIIEYRDLLRRLFLALVELTDEEFQLIIELYFNRKTLTELAIRKDIPISSLSRHRDKILKKLRRYLDDQF